MPVVRLVTVKTLICNLKMMFLLKFSFSRPLSYVQNEMRSAKLILALIEIELEDGFLAIEIRFSSSSLNFKI